MDNRFECGCERGGDCTKTTMCALQSALEDKDAEIERLRAGFESEVPQEYVHNEVTGLHNTADLYEIERLRAALAKSCEEGREHLIQCPVATDRDCLQIRNAKLEKAIAVLDRESQKKEVSQSHTEV